MFFNNQTSKTQNKALYNFFEDIVSHQTLSSDEKNALLLYKNFWKTVLIDDYKQRLFPSCNISNDVKEIFPLEHNYDKYSIVIYFDIDNTINLINQKTIPVKKCSLNDCLYQLHYSHTGKEKSFSHSTKPIITVIMPTRDENNNLVLNEVINGNHRITQAIKTKNNLTVYGLASTYLPPQAFLNEESYILYHMLIVFYFVLDHLVPDVVGFTGEIIYYLNDYFY